MYLPGTKILKGLVVYNHATLFGKYDLPANSQLAAAIATLYAASGYAVLFPNYLGYDHADNFPNPFVIHPTLNILASIRALNNIT